MKASGVICLGVLGLGLAAALGCDRQSAVPVIASEMNRGPDGNRLPFDREAQEDGISPSSSVIPPGAQIPAGTPVTIRLKNSVSSATAIADDTFEAVLEEPVVINGRIVAARGTLVTGRVVDARPMKQIQAPGYLRLALSSMVIQGKPTVLRTSSNFLKGAGPAPRRATLAARSDGNLIGAAATPKAPMLGNAMVAESTTPALLIPAPRDVTIGQDRRLTFRLIEALPLHP